MSITADDTDYRFPIWQSSTIREGRKNYYSGQSDNPKSYLLEDTYWDGRDSKGEKLEDGLYAYVWFAILQMYQVLKSSRLALAAD